LNGGIVLLHYSTPCLNCLLPLKYFRHYNYLVSAVCILLQSSTLKSEIDIANCYLANFVFEYDLLYGEVNMNFNVYLLLHLSKCVSIWGSLWLYSAFPFESGNGHLVKLIKGTKGILKRIAHKYYIYLNIPAIVNKYQNVNIEVLEYCDVVCHISFYKNQKSEEIVQYLVNHNPSDLL
ncbi:uncharacterized protein LOC118194564, partial [Stegodyphus dumicola]|uniref:uncharacterized protein LOC118194564 n=1 Tax=Stegodyphus dumicola TaxID=202533 RepID=UPI0015AE747C